MIRATRWREVRGSVFSCELAWGWCEIAKETGLGGEVCTKSVASGIYKDRQEILECT